MHVWTVDTRLLFAAPAFLRPTFLFCASEPGDEATTVPTRMLRNAWPHIIAVVMECDGFSVSANLVFQPFILSRVACVPKSTSGWFIVSKFGLSMWEGGGAILVCVSNV